MIDTNSIRNKVVDSAVIGQLTADYKSETNAETYLFNAGIEHAQLAADEEPCPLKDGWCWVRVSNLGADIKNSFADGPFGSNLKREHYTSEKQVRIIQLSNVGELGWRNDNEKYTTYEHLETIKRSEVKPGDIVIAKMMPAGRAIIVPDVSDKYVLSSDCVKFVPNAKLNTRYLCYAINSQVFRKQVLQDVHGIGRERTSLSKIKSYYLPIPPIDEQKAIVDKIDVAFDLLSIIDSLQQQYAHNLEVLKGKIIDAGIQGKLTKQLPEDGNAESLYAQIQDEKTRLIKEGKIKKEKPLPEITDNEIPFDVPKTWRWYRLIELCETVFDIDHKMPGSDPNGVLFLSAKDLLDDGTLNFTNNVKRISRHDYINLSKKGVPKQGDIIYSRIGACLGKARIVYPKIDFLVSYSCCTIRPILVDARYLQLVLDGNFVLQQAKKKTQSIGVPDLGIREIKNFLIPVPPLEEQRRIVMILDEALSFL